MVFIDVIKAFDKVWHNGLFFKIFGVEGSIHGYSESCESKI